MSTRFSRRLLAFQMALLMLLVSGFAPVASADQGLLTGRVTDKDGFQPLDGVVVALVDNESRTIYRSEPTNENGAFAIDSAPAGGYRLLAETAEGAFVASDDFTLAAGKNEPVELKLTPTATLAPGQSGAGTSWWQWFIAGTIIFTGLLVVGDASDEQPPSNFN